MRARDIFQIGGITAGVGGYAEHLDDHNCRIVDKTLSDAALVLRLRRDVDSMEGKSHLRVQNQFKEGTSQLLRWAFNSKEILAHFE